MYMYMLSGLSYRGIKFFYKKKKKKMVNKLQFCYSPVSYLGDVFRLSLESSYTFTNARQPSVSLYKG